MASDLEANDELFCPRVAAEGGGEDAGVVSVATAGGASDGAGAPDAVMRLNLSTSAPRGRTAFAASGGDEAADLGVGMPLNVFRKQSMVVMSRDTMRKSPYLAELLDGPWASVSSALVELPSLRAMDAFLDVLQHLSALPPYRGAAVPPAGTPAVAADDGSVTSRNLFFAYSAAAFLRLDAVTAMLEARIAGELSADSFVTAMRAGLQYRSPGLLESCFRWFKQHATLRLLSEEAASGGGGGERAAGAGCAEGGQSSGRKGGGAAASGAGGGGGGVLGGLFGRGAAAKDAVAGVAAAAGVTAAAAPKQFVTLDEASLELLSGPFRAPAAPLITLTTQARGRAARFFWPGEVPVAPGRGRADIPLGRGPCAGGDGFPDTTKCYVERRRGQGRDGKQTYYLCYRESDHAFVCGAASDGQSAFTLSSDPADFAPHSPSYIGYLSCNFLGTTFTIYDSGCRASQLASLAPSSPLHALRRAEHGIVAYESNILGRVPNAMTVVLPDGEAMSATAAAAEADAASVAGSADALFSAAPRVTAGRRSTEGAIEAAFAAGSAASSCTLRTKKPKWSDDLQAWTMDFKGRVKLASKKNFQLVSMAKRESRPKRVRPGDAFC
jgi:tubby-related protein 1